ncbi:Hypothetical predicted protein [Octopus vulgaris]|uniref:Uncharacterized protein n=1 Tax=Octopus vulgaris TaxID=6645 RepID=A0AA36FD83_OCTVU|nr:Hypothetical predicted protein [Octopus vulgaris]
MVSIELSRMRQQRNDYQELLELMMIFLDSILKKGISFLTPGADIDPEISKPAAKEFSIYFWYLAPETVALSIFDDNVPTEELFQLAIGKFDSGCF